MILRVIWMRLNFEKMMRMEWENINVNLLLIRWIGKNRMCHNAQ